MLCNCWVHNKSHHCMICNRCTANFDHHCKYLNNCIGGKNYVNFVRLLTTFTIYCLIVIAQAVWVFINTFNKPNIADSVISRWVILVFMVVLVIILISVDVLLCFHIYITLFRNMTTLEYIYRETPSNKSGS
jgi:hypothetical protein